MGRPRCGVAAGLRAYRLMAKKRRQKIGWTWGRSSTTYYSGHIKENQLSEACSTHTELGSMYTIWALKSQGKRFIIRCWRAWEDNVKRDIKEILREFADWIHLTSVRDWWCALVIMVMKFMLPYTRKYFLTSWKAISFSRRTSLVTFVYILCPQGEWCSEDLLP